MTAPIRSMPELFALFQSIDPDLKKLVWLLAKCSRTGCSQGGDIEIHEDDLRDYDEGKPMLTISYSGDDHTAGAHMIIRADDDK